MSTTPTTKNQAPQNQAGDLAYAAPEYAYFEGQFVPIAEAKFSIKTNAFLYGTSVFEGIRGYYLSEQNAVSIFRAKEHYDRMINNARLFYLSPDKLGLNTEKMMAITIELIQRSKPQTDVYIRPTLYKTGDVVTPSLTQTETEFCLWTKPMGQYLDLNKGLSVCVSSWRRLSDNALPPRCKAGGAYMSTALAVTDARENGFDDAVFLTEDGHVSEGSAMNLFLVKDGKLLTPGVNQKILPGITRHSVITLATQELGLQVEEREIERTELYFSEEAFFCGTGAQIAPITQFDKRPVGDGMIGKITAQLQQLYFQTVKNQLAHYTEWCTVVKL